MLGILQALQAFVFYVYAKPGIQVGEHIFISLISEVNFCQFRVSIRATCIQLVDLPLKQLFKWIPSGDLIFYHILFLYSTGRFGRHKVRKSGIMLFNYALCSYTTFNILIQSNIVSSDSHELLRLSCSAPSFFGPPPLSPPSPQHFY